MFSAKVLADSINDHDQRLTTFEITFPRFILAEVNTHRMLSRNSASSRAIPTEKIISRVQSDPFVPTFNTRVTGMGVGDELEGLSQLHAQSVWLDARDLSVDTAKRLEGVDKSRVNRLLEPFAWHTAILTATDWGNFYALRTDPQAQPEFRTIAHAMQEAVLASTPAMLQPGEWHLPLVSADEILVESLTWPEPYVDWDMWVKISVGRCARVSYLTHDGLRDLLADIGLHDKLLVSRHLSPFEHVATPFDVDDWELIDHLQRQISDSDQTPFMLYLGRQMEYHGNLHGWHSARTDIKNEHDASL
jgi:thymidylate synthase ThyX